MTHHLIIRANDFKKSSVPYIFPKTTFDRGCHLQSATKTYKSSQENLNTYTKDPRHAQSGLQANEIRKALKPRCCAIPEIF